MSRPGLLAQFRDATRPVQVIVVSVMFMTVGFYMLVPYLAAHLQQGLGFTAGIIGLVLGVRTFCQQGLYAVGGSLSDRLGCRSLIVAGALVRATGFLLFGFATTLPIVFVAAVLTGFGGVLFGPASRSYLAQETVGEHRVQTLALDGACTKIGELIGPLVGLALLAVNFQLVSLIATGVFTLLALFPDWRQRRWTQRCWIGGTF
jgi:MFS family permease